MYSTNPRIFLPLKSLSVRRQNLFYLLRTTESEGNRWKDNSGLFLELLVHSATLSNSPSCLSASTIFILSASSYLILILLTRVQFHDQTYRERAKMYNICNGHLNHHVSVLPVPFEIFVSLMVTATHTLTLKEQKMVKA